MMTSLKISVYCFVFIGLIFSFKFALASPVSSGQQGIFGTKTTADGAITVCSDALNYNQKTNELTYSGNVLVIQIKHVNLLCHHFEKNPAKLVGHPEKNISLWVDVKDKTYAQIQKEELALTKPICAKEKACRVLSGQSLTVLFDQKNQVKKVMMTADKSGANIAKFYALSVDKNVNKNNLDDKKTVTKKKPNETLSQGKVMEFIPAKQEMIISEKAKIVKDGNVFTGKKIIYNTKTKIVTVPDDGQRATMIINSDGSVSSGGH
jgi:lipopolysaccharide export system protein LptA